MKILCSPRDSDLAKNNFDLKVKLFGDAIPPLGYIGRQIGEAIRKQNFTPDPMAWDLLSIALSVVACDLAGHRKNSPDGWTRSFELTVAVLNPDFWNTQISNLQLQFGFLTTDIWEFKFIKGGVEFKLDKGKTAFFSGNTDIVLLSGGLDSFSGILDSVAQKSSPLAVSQLVTGDAEFQRQIVGMLGSGASHVQLNHNPKIPNGESPSSQRSRSVLFLAYASLMATCLQGYQDGKTADVFMYENGFISINPPLTGGRLGSLSTRTTHPYFISLFQKTLQNAGIRAKITNPYQFKTKGELLKECKNQELLGKFAHKATSCGRFRRYGFQHCGRCIPCLVRRAAFLSWGQEDKTKYKHKNLGKKDKDHAYFDDVRSAAIAIATVKQVGMDEWLGATLNSAILGDTIEYEKMIVRGLKELENLLTTFKLS